MSKRKILTDKDLLDRLVSMGLMTGKRTVNNEAMSAFVKIFFGLFIWDVSHCEATGKTALEAIYRTFKELEPGDYRNQYLMLSVQYDQLGGSLPDPVWWLVCSDEAVRGFMERFMTRFDGHMERHSQSGGDAM
jgi:hypothetical protein